MNADKQEKYDLVFFLVARSAKEILKAIIECEKGFFKDTRQKEKNWSIGLVEIMLFLLFEVDFSAFRFKQDVRVRRSLMSYLLREFVNRTEPTESELDEVWNSVTDIFDERCEEYKRIVTSQEFLESPNFRLLIDPLINNMFLSMKEEQLNNYKARHKPLSLDFFGKLLADVSLTTVGFTWYIGLRTYLKYLFQNNTDFTLLEQNGIDARIIEANKEIESLIKVSQTS